jgi:uncharacterized protein
MLAVVLAVVAFGYGLKGFVGFGTALVMVPVLAIALGPHTAVAVVSILDLTANVAMGAALRPRRGDIALVLRLALLMGIGTVATGTFVGRVPPDTLQALIGITVLGSAVPLLLLERGCGQVRPARSDARPRLRRSAEVGAFVGGLVGGLTTISGPPLVAGIRHQLQRDDFRRILVLVFAIQAALRLMTYAPQGLLTRSVGTLALAGMVPAAVGLGAGHWLSQRTSERRFTQAIIALILLAGMAALMA